jgi:hypothetical protein
MSFVEFEPGVVVCMEPLPEFCKVLVADLCDMPVVMKHRERFVVPVPAPESWPGCVTEEQDSTYDSVLLSQSKELLNQQQHLYFVSAAEPD